MVQPNNAGRIEYSERLGREIRTDGIETLGTSSLTLFEDAARDGRTADALRLLDYFWEEVFRIGEALFLWMEDIIAFILEHRSDSSGGIDATRVLLAGIRRFDPSSGDRAAVADLLSSGHIEQAIARADLGRVRYTALHDAYVAWIQQLLTDIASDFGEEAVKDVVVRTYERLWKPRYDGWDDMSPEERIQLSVEGMRGHLSGPGRRGDVGVLDEGDRFTMVLDPCGSCGILRNGDPESDRPSADPAGNTEPHPWTWFLTGKGWYSVHSPIVMEWLDMSRGRRPMRPLEGCDTSKPCRWYIYKDPDAARSEHYERMRFAAPNPPGEVVASGDQPTDSNRDEDQ